jgi:hypothetical protein
VSQALVTRTHDEGEDEDEDEAVPLTKEDGIGAADAREPRVERSRVPPHVARPQVHARVRQPFANTPTYTTTN